MLVFLCLCLPLTALADRTVTPPEANFTMTLPDSFTEQPLTPAEDPDLFLYWTSPDISLMGYLSWVGPNISLSDLFTVVTGDETEESAAIPLSGQQVLYAAGRDDTGAYRVYSWLYQGNNITLWFYYPEGNAAAGKTIDTIVASLVLFPD